MRLPFRKNYQDHFRQTRTILNEKVKEALASVLPITAIVLVLCFTISPVPTEVLLAFLVGAVLLIVGMGLFTLGADTAMSPIGERVGAHMTKSRKLAVVVLVSISSSRMTRLPALSGVSAVISASTTVSFSGWKAREMVPVFLPVTVIRSLRPSSRV